MGMTIIGFGTARPPYQVGQDELARWATETAVAEGAAGSGRRANVVSKLYTRSGVRQRGSVLFETDPATGELCAPFFPPAGVPGYRGPTTAERMERYRREALPLAARAARAGLDDAGLAAADVTHLVTVSCTGFAAPGVDIELIRELGIPDTVLRTHVGFMGCHGAFNGLRVGSAFTDSDPDAVVLVCAVELCTVHFAYELDPQQLVANTLFADGAAAVVGVGAGRAPAAPTWQVAGSGSCLLPVDTADAMTWVIGDHGFEMTLSPRVPALIREYVGPWLGKLLARRDLTRADLQSYAVHPGGPRVLREVTAALGISHDDVADSHQILATCGNMSSPTILFILDRLRRRGAPTPLVALGFGPGLTAEALLIR